MLLELCDVHRENKHILIPLEIIVDLSLYNGPFLVVLLRILYLAWKVAYDEAVLTGAIFEDDGTGLQSPTDGTFTVGHLRGTSSSRPGTGDYVGLAMVDLDEAELGRESGVENGGGILKKAKDSGITNQGQYNSSNEAVYVLEDVDDDENSHDNQIQTQVHKGSLKSSPKSSPTKTPKTVAFKLDQLPATAEEQSDDDAADSHLAKNNDTLV